MATPAKTPSLDHESLVADIAASMKAKKDSKTAMGEAFNTAAAQAKAAKELKWFEHDNKSHAEILSEDNYIMLSELCGRVDDWPSEFDIPTKTYFHKDHSDEACKHLLDVSNFSHYRADPEALFTVVYTAQTVNEPIVFISGPPSVGKSQLMKYYAAITGRPYFHFLHQPDLDSTHFLGNIKAENGETFFREGPLTQAYRTPYSVHGHDEPTAGPQEVKWCLHNVFEKGGKLALPDSDEISSSDRLLTPAEDILSLLADNTLGNGDVTGKYVGTNPLNQAFLDRPDVFVHMDYMSKDDEIKALKSYHPEATDKLLSCMVEVANLSRTAWKQDSLEVGLSFRVIQAWVSMSLAMKDFRRALKLTYINRISNSSEVEAVWDMVNTVFGNDS